MRARNLENIDFVSAPRSVRPSIYCKFSALLLALALLSGCQTTGPTEHAVRFRKLPTQFFGGVVRDVVPPGKTTLVIPMLDTLYRITTSVQVVSWGNSGKQVPGSVGEFLYTRALDGNEVALAVTVLYQVANDPKQLTKLVRDVATTDDDIRELVSTVGRADIRTNMNRLRTSAFLEKEARYEAVRAVQKSMNDRLAPLGIQVLAVTLDDFRFERLLQDGTVDSSYQDRLKDVQRLREDTEREKSRIKTVEAKKNQELNDMQAYVNRLTQEAQGYKNQAEIRGVGYFDTRSNEANGILVKGKAEVQGISEQIAALSGPGGGAMLRLELARALLASNPRFVVMGDGSGGASSSSNSLEVKRTDTNELLQQLGIFEGLRNDAVKAKSADGVLARPSVGSEALPRPLDGSAAESTKSNFSANAESGLSAGAVDDRAREPK